MLRRLRWWLRDKSTREAEVVRSIGEGISEQLAVSLKRAVDVAHDGNAALIFSSAWSNEGVIAHLLRADIAATDWAANQEQLADLPIWIDEMPLTLRELGARIGRLAAEWQSFREDGEPLRRLALVILDGWPDSEASVNMRALRKIAAMPKLEIVTNRS